MKKIKTVIHNLPEKFDECINYFLADGYELVKHETAQVGPDEWRLFALLEKETDE